MGAVEIGCAIVLALAERGAIDPSRTVASAEWIAENPAAESPLRDARVLIDGSGSRAFRLTLNAAFRRRLPAGALRSVEFKDSRSDVLVQLADMCAGAIARSYKPDRTRANRWLDALRPRIEDIWEFP